LLINCSLKIILLTVDLYKRLIQVQAPLRTKTITDTLLLDLISKQRTKPISPVTLRFVAEINLSLMQNVFYLL
jgi:hypothetical protein